MYGGPADGPLLAGIMGHNLCLDIFGGPSAEEAAAGLTAHGEASVVPYAIEASVDGVVARADFPLAALKFVRRVELRETLIMVTETVTNVAACLRPPDWLDAARDPGAAVS
jgi:hypothetical protein